MPLPIFILAASIALVGIAVFFNRTVIPRLNQSRVRKHAPEWPTVKGRLDHACVTEYRASDTEITFRLDAWFSYTVDGKSYDGTYCIDDMRHAAAKKLLSKLNHEPVIVSYNPLKPAEHFYEPKAGLYVARA